VSSLIRNGTVIEGPLWPEPVEIKSVSRIGENLRIIGALINSNEHIDQILTPDECRRIRGGEVKLDFSASGEEFFLALESYRYRNASIFDPFLAMNSSRIDPLPFQLDAVYLHALKMPRLRYMIADDPGAGKTIMAGIIIRELKLRGVATRILIVSPGHLREQWRREMAEKFDERFIMADRGFFNSRRGENPWLTGNQFITSMDFAKQDDILRSLGAVRWDLVIVDEAHKLSATFSGKIKKRTERYRLGEVLSGTSDNMLFLTATPHSGNPESFRLLLDLLEPGFFANKGLIEEARRKDENPLFIRRTKEELRDFQGNPIFRKRFTYTHSFRLSEKEIELYNRLSEYIRKEYRRAEGSDGRIYIFALMLLQRRMASSIYALRESLIRRRIRCQEMIRSHDLEEPGINISGIEDEDEATRWREEEKLEGTIIVKSRYQLDEEVQTLTELIKMADDILAASKDTKLGELRKILDEVGDEKLLIFTEFKDTLDYLVDKLEEWGYTVSTIHGQMNMEERIAAEKEFRESTQIMVATEAAGEGINLQFCHLMVNYDIPWNPNRLEQRMGRIHRYKQSKDVYVYNLAAENTREGLVVTRLLEKLERIRKDLGSDRVYDVVGEIYHEKDIQEIIREAISAGISPDEIDRRLEPPWDILDDVLKEQLATPVNYAEIDRISQRIRERKLAPEYIEEFFRKAAQHYRWELRERSTGTYGMRTPPELLRVWTDKYKNRYGDLQRNYPVFSFEKTEDDDVDFVSFGHPLFEATLLYIGQELASDIYRGAVFRDPTGRYDGVIWFFEGAVRDGSGKIAGRKIFGVLNNGREMSIVDPSVLWNLIPDSGPSEAEYDSEGVMEFAIEEMKRFRHELLREAEKRAEIKRNYGVRSLDYSINESNSKLIDYERRLGLGEDLKLAIRNEKERLSEYKERRDSLIDEIEREKTLSINMPKQIGAIIVRGEMAEDPAIERIGMDMAMKYELEHGRIPEDVSGENLGFDVRSSGPDGTRYIEVKARSGEGNVELTQNEWLKARRFRESYWLYIVSSAATSPRLHIIRDPHSKLKPIIREEVRYVIPASQWKEASQ